MKTKTKTRGVFERVAGSDQWWVRYADADGRLRRELVGAKSAAIALYQKRKNDIREGKKLPKKLRTRTVPFKELADDYLVMRPKIMRAGRWTSIALRD